MRVIAKKENTYTLQDIVNIRLYNYHINDLRSFNFDLNIKNPLAYVI